VSLGLLNPTAVRTDVEPLIILPSHRKAFAEETGMVIVLRVGRDGGFLRMSLIHGIKCSQGTDDEQGYQWDCPHSHFILRECRTYTL